MNIDLDRTIELYATFQKQYKEINPKEFMKKVQEYKKYIRQLIDEWKQNSKRSRFQRLLDQYMKEEKNFNDIFEPLNQSDVTQFKDKSISDKKIIVQELRRENINVIDGIFVIPLMNAFIGMILGELEIKHFQSVYGLLECGNDEDFSGSQSKQWCDGKSIYVFCNSPENTKFFSTTFFSISPQDFLMILLQITCALRYAKIKYNFKHNNLNVLNVRIATLTEHDKFIIFTPQGKKYINAMYIPIISNFSKSSIQLEKKIGLSSVDKRIEDYQLTQELCYFLMRIYINMIESDRQDIIRSDSHQSSKQEQTKKQNQVENKKIIQSLLSNYSEINMNIYIEADIDLDVFKCIPRAKDDLKEYDKIINSMIEMKLVKLYDA